MKRHFFEVFDGKGNRVAEIIATDIIPESQDGTQPYSVHKIVVGDVEAPPLLSLPQGFRIKKMTQ